MLPRHHHSHDPQPLVFGLLPFQLPLGPKVLHKATREDAGEGAWAGQNMGFLSCHFCFGTFLCQMAVPY